MEEIDDTVSLRIKIPTPRPEYVPTYMTQKRFKTILFIIIQIIMCTILLSRILHLY